MFHYAKAVADHSSLMTFNILSIMLYLLYFNFTTNADSHNILSVRNDVWVKSMMALTDEMKTKDFPNISTQFPILCGETLPDWDKDPSTKSTPVH